MQKSEDFANAKSDAKLKIEWHSGSTMWFVERYFGLEYSIFAFQFGEKRTRIRTELVNDCANYIQMTTFSMWSRCSHSIHLKIPQ